MINFAVKFGILLNRVGYDHRCSSFVYSCVLLLVVFLVLCIFVVGGVLDLCFSLYMFVSCLMFMCILFCFVVLVLGCSSKHSYRIF